MSVVVLAAADAYRSACVKAQAAACAVQAAAARPPDRNQRQWDDATARERDALKARDDARDNLLQIAGQTGGDV